METLPATQENSSGANPSSVKSEDGSPKRDRGRDSPPPVCAICLGTCRNKSFTDSCLHQFCFICLVTWSKIKPECPLCKQNFRSIIHNVRSNHQYEEYMVEQRQAEDAADRIDIDSLTASRRFRYRTTVTLPRRETLAFQQLLLHHYPMMADVFPPPAPVPPLAPIASRRRSPASFRRTVYRHNLWARPLPDFTGRFRDYSPEFYRNNDSQMHRLVPWLNRELHYLLNENIGHISYVMARILELLPRCDINSSEFRDTMRRYLGERTDHFLHELSCFASTPYDLTGYDRNVQYTTGTRISTMVNEVISSSESDASVDSDIVMVSSSEPAEPPAGPSGLPPPVYPASRIPLPPAPGAAPAAPAHRPPADCVIPIETISHSDTDDDSSEVMVVGYIKPPQERTPEVVDLLGSDSDVVVQESPAAPAPAPAPPARAAPLVKLTLKRQRAPAADRDRSAGEGPSRPRTRRRTRSGHSATTADTWRTTPSPPPAPAPAPAAPAPAPRPAASGWESDAVSFPTDACAGSDPATMSSTSSDSSEFLAFKEMRFRAARKKSKKKSGKDASASRKDKKKCKKRSTRGRRRESKVSRESQTERERRSKRKSQSGKGVKSSRPQPAESDEPAAGPSGAPRSPRPPRAPRSPHSPRPRRRAPPRAPRRAAQQGNRLRSVVNVMYSNQSSEESGSRVSSALSFDSGEWSSEEESETKLKLMLQKASRSAAFSNCSSDSADDIPLNLTIRKSSTVSSS